MSELLEEVKRRCDEAGLKYEGGLGLPEEERDPHATWKSPLKIYYPRGRNWDFFEVDDDDTAEMLLEESFEVYKGIEGFAATWSIEEQVIECNIRGKHSRSPLSQFVHQLELTKLSSGLDQKSSASDGRVKLESNISLSISIGFCSNIHGILLYSYEFLDMDEGSIESRPLTIQIRGTDIGRHEDAVELLRRIGDATLFQLDLSLGLSWTLEREISRNIELEQENKPIIGRFPIKGTVGEIKFEYDHLPMSLYWHGKMASHMPLLRFLAYYQVLEFYFPVYSEIAATKKLQNILKEPTFDSTRESDVSRLLRAIRVTSKGSFGNEVEQLQATIRHCVSDEDLEDFFMAEDKDQVDDHYAFYTSKNAKKVVKETIPLKEKSGNLAEATTRRIYALRNRIVHAKSGYGDQEPLFPFDSEVKYLHHDIDLVEFLVRKVLIAASRPLQI